MCHYLIESTWLNNQFNTKTCSAFIWRTGRSESAWSSWRWFLLHKTSFGCLHSHDVWIRWSGFSSVTQWVLLVILFRSIKQLNQVAIPMIIRFRFLIDLFDVINSEVFSSLSPDDFHSDETNLLIINSIILMIKESVYLSIEFTFSAWEIWNERWSSRLSDTRWRAEASHRILCSSVSVYLYHWWSYWILSLIMVMMRLIIRLIGVMVIIMIT